MYHKFKLTIFVVIVAICYTLYQQQTTTSSTNASTSPSTTSLAAPTLSETSNFDTRDPNFIFISRSIYKVIPAIQQSEGSGALVRRSVGTRDIPNFTPFLMLDHFNVSLDAGFPDHPHRGQETITYMLKGSMEHEDFTGSRGVLRPGDLQFMTAGRGVVHAEMPFVEEGIVSVEGLQLWVDLPIELKNCEPRYRDLKGSEIPIAAPNDKINVKVISGESYGVKSLQDLAYTPVWMLDITLQPGADPVQQVIPSGFNCFLYTLNGTVVINGETINQYTSVFFKPAEIDEHGIEILSTNTEARFVVIAGKMLDQPIVQHGPFVETSRARIMKAFQDYRTFTNGFERALGWASEIAKRMP